MLTYSSLSLHGVADAIGFSDARTFRAGVFSDITGIRPVRCEKELTVQLIHDKNRMVAFQRPLGAVLVSTS